MPEQDTHLSDEELVLAAEGELAIERAGAVRLHVARCAACRARLEAIETVIAAFERAYSKRPSVALPPAQAGRAQLRARIAELAAAPAPAREGWLHGFACWRMALAGAAMLACVVALTILYRHRLDPAYVPSPALTPGLARAVDRDQLCHSELPKNQVVTADMRRRVFEVYGIANADPQAYEVDYLITPALGGADDIRNLWPQPYVATAWNARVKDALEDRLRDMVCRGEVDLSDAQRDIATNWVAAYKKYFRTNNPPDFSR